MDQFREPDGGGVQVRAEEVGRGRARTLIIPPAQAAGAELLYSEDLSDGQRYGDVRVVNPLVG